MTDWLIPLLSLTAMEIVLGIDNVIFLAIIVGKLPHAQQAGARYLGLGLAAAMRVLMILGISWIMSLTFPVFTLSQIGVPEAWLRPDPAEVTIQDQDEVERLTQTHPEVTTRTIEAIQALKAEDRFREVDRVTWRDLILLAGGLFLIAKSTFEIHDKLEAKDHTAARPAASFSLAIFQIIVIDLIFSLDSVITAIGMVQQVWIMITAMLAAVGIMLAFARPIGQFVHDHPTMKMLALAFLILIGVMLVAEGLGQHLDRGYVYFAMAFAIAVEMINLRLRARERIALHNVPNFPNATI